jgi:hypothetical protein
LRVMRKGEGRMKGDERILGGGAFVEAVIKAAQENLEWAGGKQRRIVQARSVLCYWGTRELGMSAVSISKKLNIASSTASESAMRGRQIVEEHGWKLLEENKSENPRNDHSFSQRKSWANRASLKMDLSDQASKQHRLSGGVSCGVIIATIMGIGVVGVLFISVWFRLVLGPHVLQTGSQGASKRYPNEMSVALTTMIVIALIF